MPELILPAQAVAYVNHGRWVADCPRPGCLNAEKLDPGQFMYLCDACRIAVPIQWPAPQAAHDIWEALAERPNVENRNWFPAGHPLALAAGLPNGLTAAELAGETSENLARIAAEREAHLDHMRLEGEARKVVAAALAEKAKRNAQWAAEGHDPGGPLFHPEADENGFPPEHAVTRGPGQGAPGKPKGGAK